MRRFTAVATKKAVLRDAIPEIASNQSRGYHQHYRDGYLGVTFENSYRVTDYIEHVVEHCGNGEGCFPVYSRF